MLRVENRPRNTFGRTSYEVIDHYEARLTALFLAMAQNPVALEIANYENLERLVLGIYPHVPVDPRASGPFIEKQRYAAVQSAAYHALTVRSSPAGRYYGIRIAMRFKWQDTAMSLAQKISTLAADGDYAAQWQAQLDLMESPSAITLAQPHFLLPMHFSFGAKHPGRH